MNNLIKNKFISHWAGLETTIFPHFGTTFYLIRVGSCPWIPHSFLCAKHLINISEPLSGFRIQQTLKSTHKVCQLIKSLRVQQNLKLTTLLFVQPWSLYLAIVSISVSCGVCHFSTSRFIKNWNWQDPFASLTAEIYTTSTEELEKDVCTTLPNVILET